MNNIFNFENSLELSAIKLAKLLNEVFRKVYKEYGFQISHEEFTILDIIKSRPGVIPIEIASIIFTQRSYVCKLLTKLENLGYITQENGIRGKKQVIIKNYITDSGLQEYNKIFNALQKMYLEESLEEDRKKANKLIEELNKTSDKIIKKHKIKF